jgi:hypothetical protein
MPLSSVLGAQSVVQPGVCTSSTRPAVPYEGQTIYETDTDLVRSWNGSSWVTIGPTNTSGFQPTIQSGQANVDTSQTITTGGYGDLATVQSVTLTTGTKALVSFGFFFTRPSPESTVYMSFAVTGATSIGAGSFDFMVARGYTYSQADMSISRSVLLTNLNAGSNTFTAKFARGSTNCNAYGRSFSVVAL